MPDILIGASERPVSFRIIVRLPGSRGIPGYSECESATDAFSICQRLARGRIRVEQILDLRWGDERPISAPELEAIAQRERHGRRKAAIAESCDFGGMSWPYRPA